MTERTKCESNPSRGSEDLQASRSSSRIRLNVDLLARLAIAALVVLFLTISVGAEVFAVTQEDCPQGYYGEFIRSEYDASGNTTTFFYRAYQPGT
jgi:hypothetical protein